MLCNFTDKTRSRDGFASENVLLPLCCTGVGVTGNTPEKDTGAHNGHQDGEYEGSQSQGRHRLKSSTF